MAKESNANDSKPKGTPANTIDVRSGLDVESLKQAITEHLFFQQGRNIVNTALNGLYMAVS